MRWSRRRALAGFVAVAAFASGCTRREPESPSPVPQFALHEWGLIAVDANEPARAHLATEVAGGVHLAEISHGTTVFGLGRLGGTGTAYGGKPVIYVHLEPGVAEATFDLRLGVPAANLVERWPGGSGHPTDDASGWRHVVARRGACASPTPPPTATSPECTGVRDGFCEAAEIPRYYGSRASCLEVGAIHSELLFYRAEGIATGPLPLRMARTDETWRPVRSRADAIVGPIFFITAKDGGREVAIRVLESNELDTYLPDATGQYIDPTTARDLIRLEAVQRGLSESEADAFADAWAPAVFARCRREGPEAAGTLPTAFEQSMTSLVYFAPPAAVDAMIPLATTPPAARANRVFLVRYVDGGSTIDREDARRISEQLAADAAAADAAAAARAAAFPPPSGRPSVRPAGSVRIQGGLTADQVRRVLQRNIGQVQHCYEQALARKPELGGRILVSFVITPTGSVASASADNGVGDPPMSACVAAAVRRFAFPQPDPPGPVRVEFPFNFSQSPAN